jgi:hypothetical protein
MDNAKIPSTITLRRLLRWRDRALFTVICGGVALIIAAAIFSSWGAWRAAARSLGAAALCMLVAYVDDNVLGLIRIARRYTNERRN